MKNDLSKTWNGKKRCCAEVVVAISIVVVVFAAALTYILNITLPKWLLIGADVKKQELFSTLFTVQASVATVSIAIVSILTGVINETHLGISITSFITNIKPVIFKHSWVIVALLLISAANYCSLALQYYNVCIAFFFSSIVLAIILIKDVSTIFTDKEKIKGEIKEYLKHYCSDENIDRLKKEWINATETRDTRAFDACSRMVGELVEQNVGENYNEEVSKKIIILLCDVYERSCSCHDSKLIYQLIEQLCSTLNLMSKNGRVDLLFDLWDRVSTSYYYSLKDLSYEQLSGYFVFNGIHDALYHKAAANDELYTKLHFFAVRVYYVLYTKRGEFKKEEWENLLNRIYRMPANYYFEVCEDSADNPLLQELCFLHKGMIDKCDFASLKNCYFKYLGIDLYEEKDAQVFVITALYLYYLAYREPAIQGSELQLQSRMFIEENRHKLQENFWEFANGSLDIKFVDKVQTLMFNWEHFGEGEVKEVIIDKVIDDFFIFSALEYRYSRQQIIELLKTLAKSENYFSLYNHFFSNDEKTDHAKKEYKTFIDVFSYPSEDEQIDGRLHMLKDILGDLFKTGILENSEKNKITSSEEDHIAKLVADVVTKVQKDELSVFEAEKDLPHSSIKHYHIMSCDVPEFFFHHESLDSRWEQEIKRYVYISFFEILSKKMSCKQISYSEKNKQEQLIQLAKDASLNPTFFMGCKEFFGNEDNPNLLSEYMGDISKIILPGGNNFYLLLDENKMRFSLSNIQVKIDKYSWEEISCRCEKATDDKWNYCAVNDISLSYSPDELKAYFGNVRRHIHIYADVKTQFADSDIGAGIVVSYGKNA